MKHVVARGVALSMVVGAVPALAQEAIPEVVVTAQFREQKLQETPIAITAISGDLLEARSQTSIADVTAQSPNETSTFVRARIL